MRKYQRITSAFSITDEQNRQAERFNVHPLIIHLLAQRNITQNSDIEYFLYPSLSNLPDPFTLLGMSRAVSLVSETISSGNDIIIWGDYDVDGITATCLLVTFFESIGIDAGWYIPNRFSEGYGLNVEALQKIHLKAKGDSPLLITVDCGISNTDEIIYAKNIGYKVIVTDHHEPPEDTIKADAILNPKQKGCSFVDKNLAGVGMAFYLAAGIRSHLKSEGYFNEKTGFPNLKEFLGFVAIGTLADMVWLSPTNRILVKAGFETLASTSNLGISALLESNGIQPGTITSEDISFSIAPKLNAAGRLGRVETAIDLLLCKDKKTAAKLAKKLTDINSERKKICAKMLDSTLNISSNYLFTNNNCIILSGEYHLGVLGIVASQLVNLHHVPAIIFSLDRSDGKHKTLKGSGRSIPGLNLIAILRKCDKYLLKYGGHAMAAGLSLNIDNLNLFKEYFSSIVKETIKNEPVGDTRSIDAEYPIDKIFDNSFLSQFQKLEPFGVGNEKPVFADPEAFIYDYRPVGRNGDHLKIFFRGKYANIQGIGFNLGHKQHILQEKRSHTVIFSPTLNRYRTGVSWEVRLLDIL